jgi:hypothetical protein
MDTTIENAIKIIANPVISDWRKQFWVKTVKEEIDGLCVAKLFSQAEVLENQLLVAMKKGTGQ